MNCISIIIIDPPSQSGQVIESPTHIREIFQDVEGASSVFAESPQFDQDTTKSLLEVMVKMMKMKKVYIFKMASMSFPSGNNIPC